NERDPGRPNLAPARPDGGRGAGRHEEEHVDSARLMTWIEGGGRVVVLGEAGSGKSTLLRFIAQRCAAEPTSKLPVYVRLRDFAGTHRHQPTSLRSYALNQAAAGDPALRGAFEHSSAQGHVAWLLDGLD